MVLGELAGVELTDEGSLADSAIPDKNNINFLFLRHFSNYTLISLLLIISDHHVIRVVQILLVLVHDLIQVNLDP